MRLACAATCGAVLLSAIADGCGGGGGDRSSEGSVSSAAGATLAAARGETTSTVAPKAVCPPTGRWSLCSVMERLDRAGLAPRRDSAAKEVRLAPLARAGTHLMLGAAELDVFIYDDAASRERDEARLDKGRFIDATAEPTLRGEATLIRSENLLAILRSRNDHQRERVSDAITAGPPQPASAVPIAGSAVRR